MYVLMLRGFYLIFYWRRVGRGNINFIKVEEVKSVLFSNSRHR